MNGRVYDYNLGRFLSVDPLIQSPTSTQSVNPYSYVMNNPLAGTDPTGYMGCAASRINSVCDTTLSNFGGNGKADAAFFSGKSYESSSNGASSRSAKTTQKSTPTTEIQAQSQVATTPQDNTNSDGSPGAPLNARWTDSPDSEGGNSDYHGTITCDSVCQASYELYRGIQHDQAQVMNAMAEGMSMFIAPEGFVLKPLAAAVGRGITAMRVARTERRLGVWNSSRIDAAKLEHIFSSDHVRKGIMELGGNKNEILQSARNALMNDDKAGRLRNGMNTVVTRINGQDATIRTFIKDGEMKSMNLFKGTSDRGGQNVIDLR